jgi:hypothetical protein
MIVLPIIASGGGTTQMTPEVAEHCEWIHIE